MIGDSIQANYSATLGQSQKDDECHELMRDGAWFGDWTVTKDE
jgi:hypothetical protein